MVALKVRKVGNSLGVVLPREALDRPNIEDGATLFLTEASDVYRVAPYAPEFERQMALAEEGMAAYRNTLRALVK